jgi:type II secretory pathway pseudopilin PulG
VQDKEKPKIEGKKIFWTVFKSFCIFIILLIIMSIILPGMVWYRPEQYCQYAKSDANHIAAAIADYFTDPEHTTLPTINGESVYLGFTLHSNNGKDQNIAWVTGDALSKITIVVQDSSGKCPESYQEHSPDWNSGKYTKIMNWN